MLTETPMDLTVGVYLESSDTYRFSGQWHVDTIDDSDGQGVLWVEGIGDLSADDVKRTDPGSNVWQTDDERLTFAKVVVDSSQEHLDTTVRFDTNGDGELDTAYGMALRNWSDGHLGISLGSEVAEPEEDPNVFCGDFSKRIEDGRYSVDARGNYLSDGAQTDARDMILGTSYNDSIDDGGNDGLEGSGGDDLIESGARVRACSTHESRREYFGAANCEEFVCAV